MKRLMTAALGGICLAMTTLATAVTDHAASQAPDRQARDIQARGCVQPGVEAGCMVLKDLASGAIFNLLVKDQPRPAFGAGIAFSGSLFQGTTACNQGAPVVVRHWDPDPSLQCRPEQPPQE